MKTRQGLERERVSSSTGAGEIFVLSVIVQAVPEPLANTKAHTIVETIQKFMSEHLTHEQLHRSASPAPGRNGPRTLQRGGFPAPVRWDLISLNHIT